MGIFTVSFSFESGIFFIPKGGFYMKKIFGVLLSILCICCIAIGLTGCSNNGHVHSFDKQVISEEYLASSATCTEAATYYYSCSCGEKGTETFTSGNALGHSFTNYVSDNNATCTEDGTKTAKCDRDGCNEKDTVTNTGSKLSHTFDKQVANEKYLASAATCTEAAKYYYSCSCGEKGTETFTSGNALGHSFTNYVSDNNATCTKDGTKTAVCDRDGCNEKDTVTDVGSAKGHTYSEKWTYNESEHWHSATCGHNVEKDRAAHTFDESKKCTVCDYITVKPSGLELQSSVFNIDKSSKTGYLKVANAVTDYDFSDKFTVANGAKFDLCTDKQCNNKIASKRTDLVAGDNVFYILVTNGNDVASYTLTLRRRPIYTVTFNANGGTAVSSQSIEEDAIIPEPVTTRAGYTFISWSYDFTQPIIEDTIITAAWTANTNTAYKVEYYLENVDNADYSLYETENLQGTTDATATAEIKTYDHFTFYKNNSILSGNVSGDGSLVLKVYYTRNTYTLSNANTSYGKITNATTKKYGNKIDSVATEYPGCEFLGWYNGEELLSTAKEYTFIIVNNVTAKFKIKDEMSNFNFSSSVDTCNITGLKDKTVSEIIIPDYVTSIGDRAFSGCSGLTSVAIPDSVTSIGYSAFEDCSGLTSVTIGNSVTSIGNYAFNGCSGLTSVTIPDSVTSIGKYAFENCSGLTIVTIGNSVTSIGIYAFSYCSGLTSVTIGNSVTSIGDWAFDGCSGLTSVTIPNSVTSIGDWAFRGCSGLTSVTIGNSVTSIGDGAFGGCSKLVEVINKSGLNITKGSFDNGYVGYYALNVKKDGISNIVNKDGYLFYTYDNVNYLVAYVGSNTDLTLPDDYNGQNYELNNDAFFNSGLTSVTIPNSVTSIGGYAFSGCSGLTSVTIGNKVTSIGDSAFYYCSGLTSVTIPDSVTSIGDWAFRNCSGLTSVTIPDSVTSIGDLAFYYCSGLTSVTIGNGVTSIGDCVFEGCYKLVEVINKSGLNIEKGSEDNGYVGYYALNVKKDGISNIVNKDGYLFYTYDNINYLLAYVGSNTNLTLPDDYNGQNYKLYNYAFYRCSGLTSVTIPDSVTSIGWGAFYGCSGLTSVTIPDSVTSIGEWAFSDCSGLTSVTIPDSVTSIGERAFHGCSGLTSVTIGNGVTSIGDRAFKDCSSLTSVIWNAENCTSAGSIFSDCLKLTNVTIGENVKTIPNYAFYGCSGLTSVTIGNSVTSIGNKAFSGCSSLTSVTIPDSVISIGEYAFYDCSGLESLTVSSDNTKYHSSKNCLIETESRKLILGCNNSVIPTDGSVTSIGEWAFRGCSSLKSVTIPDSVTSIGNEAFRGCSGLTSITIPDSVTSIGYYAFYDCSGLTSVTIGNSVTSIDNYAFYGCSGLTSVTIGNSVTSIGKYAFRGCSGLTSIEYKGTKAQWEAIEKGYNWNYEVPTTCVIHCTDGDIKLFK